jgi:Flp pilus assembly protein TadD
MKALAEAQAIANASRALLAQGDPEGAERVLKPVFNQLRSDATVLHLMGVIKRAQNQLQEAERYLRSAVAYSLSEAGYYNDLGVVLQARGAYDEAMRVYRAAQALTPHADAVRVNIVHCLMECGQLAEAEREARAYVAKAPSAETWTLLGQVQRNQERHEDAVASAAEALKYQPRMRALHLNYANALDRAGRGREALEVYESLAKQALDSAELALSLARAQFTENKKKEAEAVLEQGVEKWPTSIQLHTALARVRALRGEDEKATAFAEAEIEKRPQDIALRLATADALHRGKQHQRALQILADTLKVAPDSAAVLTAFGIILDELDRPLDGLKALRHAAERSDDARNAQRNMLSTLVRAGQPQTALEIVRALRAADPDEQYLIAIEALALRRLGDDAYKRFNDFERYVRCYDVEAPSGYFTVHNFNATLADALRQQHRLMAHPFDQMLHNGSQTGRNLIALKEPVISTFMKAADASVREYISRLPADANDPVGRRKQERYRYENLSSMRFLHEGYLPNQTHDRGWITGLYVAAYSPAEQKRFPRAGHIMLGAPNRPVIQCGPEQWIEPKEGLLVLFPSYIWHGIAPIEGVELLTLTFDVMPVKDEAEG